MYQTISMATQESHKITIYYKSIAAEDITEFFVTTKVVCINIVFMIKHELLTI